MTLADKMVLALDATAVAGILIMFFRSYRESNKCLSIVKSRLSPLGVCCHYGDDMLEEIGRRGWRWNEGECRYEKE